MAVRVGLLGGSFDPVHLAHIALSRAAIDTLALDEMQLLPAADPWQKPPLAATAEQRLQMLHLAIRDTDGISVNASEIERGGTTYTIDTLLALPRGPSYYWVLGSDQLQNFCSWYRWDDIARKVTLAVVERPGSLALAPAELDEHLRALGQELLTIPFEPISVSSTEIRSRLAQGLSTRGMLDEAVAHYIECQQLYRAPDAST